MGTEHDTEIPWDQHTGRFPTTPLEGDGGVFRQVVDALPLPTVVLDRFGVVFAANAACCDLLQLRESDCRGEPLLTWIDRGAEREAFGRAFLGLRGRDAADQFSMDLTLTPALGPPVAVVATVRALSDGQAVVSCERAFADRGLAEAEVGRAITRSLDALDQGVLLIDGDGQVVHANPAARRLLGDGIMGRSFLSLAEPSRVDELSRALALGSAGGWQGEVEVRRLDGEPLPLELSLAVGSGDGAPGVVLLRDLRERRRRAYEERLVAQIDRCLASSPEPRGGVLAACAALARGVGADQAVMLVQVGGAYERWSVRGDSAYKVETAVLDAPPPEAWAEQGGMVECGAANEAMVRVFGPIAQSSGGGRLALRAAAGVLGHLFVPHGDPGQWDARDRALIGMLGSQLALGLANGLLTLEARALASYQAMILDQTSVLLDTVDAQGSVVTWNRASEALLGFSAAEALGRRFGVEVAAAVEAGQWSALWEGLLARGVFSTEITLRSRDDKEIPLHLEGRLLREGDRVRGAVLVGLDLRDRRTLERQVLRSQKLAAVGLLAAGIAHEINNPLSGVVGYSRLLLDRKDLSPPIRERVEKIAHSGERCRKIVEGVLLFSRRQDGGPRRPVDLRNLLDSVVAIGEYQWRMHNVRILREANESVEVLGDADQLEQVVLNLLANAVDAMPSGGAIALNVRRDPGGTAVLTVSDQGQGIPEEIQARIFDPFFSTKEIGKGTGLGLAISYGIVQDHGGDIVVESAPGAGATFTVTLPAAPHPSPAVEREHSPKE